MNKKQIIFTGFAVAILFTLWNIWAGGREAKLMKQAEAYEKCVWDKWGMHPSAIYKQIGEYPPCQIDSSVSQ